MKRRLKMIVWSCFLVVFPSFAQILSGMTGLDDLPRLKSGRLIQVSSYDTTGGNNDRINLKPGAKALIADLTGPGMITRIWVTIDSRDPHFLRRIVLRMFWDDELNPSVEVPIGDFFGTGFEYKHYHSQFFGMTSGGYFCYLPMPFNRRARIEIENQTGQELYAFYYHISYQKSEKPLEGDVAYFHCQWRREPRTDSKSNYLILEADGHGHFVGLNMSMQGYDGNLWYLEGDEMVFVDGEKAPSIHGTGIEDYFNSGWYFNRGEFASPYHGLILKNDSLSRIAAYRFHVGDAIPFERSLRFTIEHGHANEEIADFSSTAFWYQKEPHKPFPPLLKPGMRIPLRVTVPNGTLEAESLKPLEQQIRYQVDDMSDYGADWSGFKQLKIFPQPDQKITLAIPTSEDRYDISLYLSKGPSYGNVAVYSDHVQVGEWKGYSTDVVPGGAIQIKNLRAFNNQVVLSFQCTGKDPRSSDFHIGLDAFVVEPVRDYIPEWYLIGPFPNHRVTETDRRGLDTVFPPEQEINLTKIYGGVDDQVIRWILEKTPESGYFSLYRKFTPNEFVVAYALTYIYSPKEQTIPLLLGSDDGIKVFLNERPVHRFLAVRIAAPDQDRIPLALKPGWNKLLLKIENNFGGYGFYARLLDLDRTLTIRAEK